MSTRYAERYRVVKTPFWWQVAIGDGQQTVGKCHSQTEAERLAAALLTAFCDGEFLAQQQLAAKDAELEVERIRLAACGVVLCDKEPVAIGLFDYFGECHAIEHNPKAAMGPGQLGRYKKPLYCAKEQ